MECNDKNKRKFQCGGKSPSACVEYAGWIPKWSELLGEDCVTVEEVLEEQYKVLDKILSAIDVSSLGRGCVDYPSNQNRTVAMVLAAFEDLICGGNGRRAAVYVNEPYTVSRTKIDVPSGFEGTSVEYEVPEGKYVSSVSQQDANALAISEAAANAQEYANRFGSYKAVIYYNEEISKDFVKNDCPGERPCGKVTYKVRAGKYSSTVSQMEANNLAMEDAEKNGQAFANANGKCKKVYYSKYISRTFYKNDCPAGTGDAEGYLYELPSGAITSEISQHDADTLALDKAMKEGQEEANKAGTCSKIYYSKEVSNTFYKTDCDTGYRGKAKIYSFPSGEFTSYVSQADADAKAQMELYKYGREAIKSEGECVEQMWGVSSHVFPIGTAFVTHEAAGRDGDVIDFIITPLEDFSVDYVMVNGVKIDLVDNKGSFTLSGQTSIKVYTRPDASYQVAAFPSDGNGGIASILTGDREYKAGESCIIEAIPAANYVFSGWFRNGVMVSLSKTYSFIVGRNTEGEYLAVFDKITD